MESKDVFWMFFFAKVPLVTRFRVDSVEFRQFQEGGILPKMWKTKQVKLVEYIPETSKHEKVFGPQKHT